MDDFDFNPEEANSFSSDDIQESLGFCETLENKEIKAIRTLMGSFFTVDIVDLSEICLFKNIPRDILDKFFSQLREMGDDGFSVSCPFFFNSLTRKELKWAILHYHDKCIFDSENHNFWIAVQGILLHGIDKGVRNTLIKNHAFFLKILGVKRALDLFFESDRQVLKHIFKFYINSLSEIKEEEKEEFLWRCLKLYNTFFKTVQLSDRDISYVIKYCPRWILLRCNFRYYQRLSYEQLRRMGFDSDCWALSRRQDGLRGPVWTRRNDLNMISVNMTEEAAFRCAGAKNEKVLKWLAIVGPEKVLPLLININEEISDIISARMRGEDIWKIRGDWAQECFFLEN